MHSGSKILATNPQIDEARITSFDQGHRVQDFSPTFRCSTRLQKE